MTLTTPIGAVFNPPTVAVNRPGATATTAGGHMPLHVDSGNMHVRIIADRHVLEAGWFDRTLYAIYNSPVKCWCL